MHIYMEDLKKGSHLPIYLVYVTLPVELDAQELAESLVYAGHAAGVNILGPVASVFAWQGEIHKADERILLAQVAGDKLDDFENALLARHPYLVPCILGFEAAKAHQAFHAWVINPCAGGGK